MFIDDGYDTDDTDELLASKMCMDAPVIVAQAERTQGPAKPRSDEGSCLVQDDWLFSLDCGERSERSAALSCLNGRSCARGLASAVRYLSACIDTDCQRCVAEFCLLRLRRAFAPCTRGQLMCIWVLTSSYCNMDLPAAVAVQRCQPLF